MSQDTFPFAVDEATGQYDPAEDAAKKKKLAIAGLVGVVVLAGAYLVLGGGGGAEEQTFIPRAPRAAQPAAAAPKAVVKAAPKLPVAYQGQIGRDPFKALYVEAVAAAPAADTTATTATTTTAATTTTSDGDTKSVAATQEAPAAAPAPAMARYALKLVAISQSSDSEQARFTTWTVDGVKKTVLPAQKFGKYGELVVLAFSKNAKGVVDKAILQVGDDSPMEVAVGQTNSVL